MHPTSSNEDCLARGLPPMLHWRMRSGVVLHSVFAASVVDVYAKKHRCYLRRYVPHGAVAWFEEGGPERPLSELPKAWGLFPLTGDRTIVDDEEEDG